MTVPYFHADDHEQHYNELVDAVNLGGGAAQASVRRSGDTSGATDTAAIQAAINAAYTAGGGLVQLSFAPSATPYWITQINMRAGVIVAGCGRMTTVLKAPLGQTAGTHMCVNSATATEGNYGLRDLTLHGNNGFANVAPANWGLQTNAFDGIHWITSGGSGLGSLTLPFGADHLLELTNVGVVSMSGKGVYLETAASGVFNRVYVYWTKSHGIDCRAYDQVFSDCIVGFAGASLADAAGFGQITAYNFTTTAIQVSNCKAWWPQTNFKQTNPITWDAAAGYGYAISAGDGFVGDNLFAQDCGVGYGISGGSNARIRGHAQNCKVAASISGGDNADVEVTVDYADNGSLVSPQYAFASAHGAAVNTSKVRVKYADTVTFSNGPGYFDTNGTALAGSDVEVKCAGSQVVAYAASVTPTPYVAPIHYIGTLTGNIAIGAPVNTSGASDFTGVQPYDGQWMELHLTQDGTGGRTVTFNAAFGTPTAIPTTANTTTVWRGRWDSTQAKWREISRSTSA